MRVTRRFWTVAVIGLLFSVGAVTFKRPLLFGGTVGLGAWLVASQVRFVQALAAADDRLTVTLDIARPQVATDEPTEVILGATVDDAVALTLRAVISVPVGTRGSGLNAQSLTIGRGETTASTVFRVQAPVAGEYTFDPVQLHATDVSGLFTETFVRGPTPTLTIEPRAPRDIHVGEGGQEVAAAFGEHETGRLGTGIEPAEIREYQPGDQAHRIDWKATARLNHPYVREYEAETDRVTAILFDQRESMQEGRNGETKLDYLRQVALAFVNSARSLNDPIGLYLVGDEGTTGTWEPNAGHNQYTRLRAELHRMRPTGARQQQSVASGVCPRRIHPRTPAAARDAANSLATDSSRFATILRPYFAAGDPYVARIESNPLYGTAERYITGAHGHLWTIIFTDDSNRAELRETVKLVRQGENHVLVFLTPSVLFRPGGLSNLDAAFTEYRGFEEFRRTLAQLPRVTALEVGPGDRLDAILQAGRDTHGRQPHHDDVKANE